MAQVETKACEHDFHWYLANNEEGWKCCSCGFRPGEPEGFSPELDRSETYRKAFAVCSEMHDAKLIYISNGTMGDGVAESVAARCKRAGIYDQQSIMAFVIEAIDTRSHAKFWKDRSKKILAGKDDRERCACGKLANRFSYFKGEKSARCSSPECEPANIALPF